jgi:hypothetical protein
MIWALWNSTWQPCKMTRRRTEVRGRVVIFLAWVKYHIFFKGSTPPTVPTKPPFQRVLIARSLVVRWPARERDYSSYLVSSFKIYGLIPPFPTLHQGKHRYNLASNCNSMIKTRPSIISMILIYDLYQKPEFWKCRFRITPKINRNPFPMLC